MSEWRAIPGHPDYEINREGVVRSWKFWARQPDAQLPRVIRTNVSTSGIVRVQLGLRGGTHRTDDLVQLAFGEDSI